MASGDSGRTAPRKTSSELDSSTSTVSAATSTSSNDTTRCASPRTTSETPDTCTATWPLQPPTRALDSQSTTASDNLVTPLSGVAGAFGIGAYVDSPTAASMPVRHPWTRSSLSQHSMGDYVGYRSEIKSSGSPKQRPTHLDLQNIETSTIDLTDPSPHTALSTCSAHSTMSNELLDLSNLRRSIQQNLRERPIGGHGESDLELESIDESERSYPSSPLDQGRTVSVSNAIAIFRTSYQFLVVDTRVLEEFTCGHVKRSVNVSIPTLLLNRLRKQTTRAGVAGWVSLTRYVSTAAGQALWDSIDLTKWLDIVIVGVDEDDTDAPYTLADILEPLVTQGTVRVVDGGWKALVGKARQAELVVTDASVDPESVVVTNTSADTLTPLARAPTSLLISPATAAPAPSQTNVPAISPLAPMQSARVVPNLSINTPSATTPRRPPKLQLNLDKPSPPIAPGLIPPPTAPYRSNRPKLGGLTIDVGSSRVPTGPQSAFPYTTGHSTAQPRLPGLTVNNAMSGAKTSTLAPPGEPWAGNSFTPPTSIAPPSNFSNLPPPTPNTLTHSSGPLGRPPPQQPPIEVSTILPSFLFLGPEITTQADVDELQSLGVRRILNVAIECDDDEGLNLKEVFDKYYRIPMKDSVDESGVNKGIRDACKILDDARLHSSPVYVHCKAGKSRSVTVVLAYLIHANAWSLHTSYQYVAERRHGISPNIGFVAELMEFETAELGHKQPGREESATPTEESEEPQLKPREPRLGPRYTRESLPPEFGSERLVDDDSDSSPVEEPVTGEHAPEANNRLRRKPQPDIEVRKNGQWVLRRTPVDRVTLQPGRRSSKAGLESMMMRSLRRSDE